MPNRNIIFSIYIRILSFKINKLINEKDSGETLQTSTITHPAHFVKECRKIF